MGKDYLQKNLFSGVLDKVESTKIACIMSIIYMCMCVCVCKNIH